MPYTFLADIDYLRDNKNKSIIDYSLYQIFKIYLDQNYGFVKDMNTEFRNPEHVKSLIVPSKIFVDAGKMDKIKSRQISGMIVEFGMLLSAYPLKKATGLCSDGAVVNDPKYLEELGALYEMNDDNYHFYCDQKEYILKRAHKNLSKIHY